MKICIISKYPPIQGGIAAKTFWLAQGLAEKGIETHVVTNANCVEKDYLVGDPAPQNYINPSIHFIDPDIPWHIPYSELYISRLLDKTLEIIDKTGIDLIDTHYLIPYGIVGYLASKIKGIPYIIRHGGSDISKFIQKKKLNCLINEVIKDASAIITDNKNKNLFLNKNSKLHILPRYIPDEKHFKPSAISRQIPVFAYIGKINYYWKYKSLDKIVTIFSGILEDYKLIFVGQGKGFNVFSAFIKKNELKSYEIQDFIHPLNMPDLFGKVDFLLYFDKNNPVKDFSNIIYEALLSGVSIIKDAEVNFENYQEHIEIKSQQLHTIETDNIEQAQNKITSIIKNWTGSIRYRNKIKYHFDEYINANIELYGKSLR